MDLTEHRIPHDAKILDIVYNPKGAGLSPIPSMTSDLTTPHRNPAEIPNSFYVLPLQLSHKEVPREAEVDLVITWIPHAANDEPWENLLNACRAYFSKQYRSAVIPANVAVEARLGRLLTAFFQQFVSKDRTKNFIEDIATYSYQLNVLLPTFTKLKNLPVLPDTIRGQLNRLRDYRNNIAHRGAPENPLGEEDMAMCLCAAIFGFHYVHLIEPILLGTEVDCGVAVRPQHKSR